MELIKPSVTVCRISIEYVILIFFRNVASTYLNDPNLILKALKKFIKL